MADKPWSDMSPEERRDWRIDRWRNSATQFASSEAEAAYTARVNRIIAAITLEKPDRVPVNLNVGFWPAQHAGLTPYDVMHDSRRAAQAWLDFNLDFQPDAIVSPAHNTVPAAVYETLDYKLYSWPGHGAAKTAGYQYIEKEWMLADEYDLLIADPSDFLLRTYYPRIAGAFSGFAGLSHLMDCDEFPIVLSHMGGWGSPEMMAGLEKILEAARHTNQWWAETVCPVVDYLQAVGFPSYFGGLSRPPFDLIGDTLRGTRGIILDMFRQPDKVLAACERLVPVAINWTLRRPTPPSTPVVFIPLHKGADGFMSDEQFTTFYWPTLRKLLLGLIEEGLIPFCFAEGRYNSRLEIITDLPKGTTVWLFDQTDMARAKQTIGKVACIEGNMPLSLLHAGTPQQVADHTRKLIDLAGEGGGYIMDLGAVADGGKDENLRAMVNTVKEYGVY